MNRRVPQAFQEASDGWSADRVVADPALNARFIQACRRRGLDAPPIELNLKLLNIRKRGMLPTSTRRTMVRNQDAFAFAAEIAIRCLERRHGTTLDRVLCDPMLAREFDSVAAAIAPGFTLFEYRWAALALRKAKRLKPEILGRALPSVVFGPVAISRTQIASLPNEQGLYILANRKKVLYVGEAQNLRARIKKHLDHSDNKLLARYMWEFGGGELFIEYHVLPKCTPTHVRKAMEIELIRSRRAEFNVQR